jgi:hypothetical protein
VATKQRRPAQRKRAGARIGLDRLTAALAHAAALASSLDSNEDFATRITDAERKLRDLGVDPYVWWKLVLFVGWASSWPSVDNLPEDVERELVQKLGERSTPVAGPDYLPSREELNAEVERLKAVHGADPDTAQSAALSTLQARHLERLLGHSVRLMREPPAWEAAISAAFAAAALLDPQALSAADEYFERLDDVRRFDEKKNKLGAHSKGQSTGGRERKRLQPQRTRQRNEQLIVDYDRAVVSDRMTRPDALRYAAVQHGLTEEQARRIIKPQSRWPRLRAILAKSAS